jgi:putative ABC transport system permease protein
VQQWPHLPGADVASRLEKIDAWQLIDLQVLRQLPDVTQAAASSGVPVLSGFDAGDIALNPGHKGLHIRAAYYYGDDQLIPTFGLHLVAGRNFSADEIRHGRGSPGAPVVIVSKPVADALFPRGNALGQTIYQDDKPAQIVGIVERLQTPKRAETTWAFNSIIEPVRQDDYWASYIVRARPGRTSQAIREVRQALLAVNPSRLINGNGWGVEAYSDIRTRGYFRDRGMAFLMGAICVILLGVTSAGIVGLTSFWVVQRYRQIGVRRALGARAVDILRYFQLENILIVAIGVAAGDVLAFALNRWLMEHYELAPLPYRYVWLGALAMFVLGQASVLIPARRASQVPPIAATRMS